MSEPVCGDRFDPAAAVSCGRPPGHDGAHRGGCGWCSRPIERHSIDEARICVAALLKREANYCRLTGPRRPA